MTNEEIESLKSAVKRDIDLYEKDDSIFYADYKVAQLVLTLIEKIELVEANASHASEVAQKERERRETAERACRSVLLEAIECSEADTKFRQYFITEYSIGKIDAHFEKYGNTK